MKIDIEQLKRDKDKLRLMLKEYDRTDKSRPITFSLVTSDEDIFHAFDKLIIEKTEKIGLKILTRDREGERRIWRLIGKEYRRSEDN